MLSEPVDQYTDNYQNPGLASATTSTDGNLTPAVDLTNPFSNLPGGRPAFGQLGAQQRNLPRFIKLALHLNW